MEYFLDWKFWSLLISILALTLSQLPPIRLLLKPKKILVEVHSKILIAHKVGNPNICLYVSVHNNGGKRLRIIKISCSVKRDGVKICELPAQNYFQDSNATHTTLFVPFHLEPDQTWDHATNFFKDFDREKEKKYRKHLSILRSDILEKLDNRPEKDKEPVKADPNLVVPFTNIYEELFVWNSGEYIIELNVDTYPGSASFTKNYRFTLFESDEDELKSHSKDYITGAGLTHDVASHVSVFVPLTEHKESKSS